MPTLGRKTKAVKLTSACYPDQENSPIIGSNLDALIKYALMTPQKLAEIGKYVEKRVLKAIIKKQYGYLKISLEIFRAIINSCTANLLTFYAPYVVSSLHEIMKQYKKVGNTNTAFFNDILIMASETFIEFAKQRFNNNITEYQDLGFFLEYFTDMSSYESPDKDQKKKMRLVGLTSLHTYITTIEDLDTFVAKYVDITKHTRIIHTVLSNLLEYFKEVEADERKSVKKLSFSCLTELARSVSPITIQTLLTAIISFLDSKQVWMNRDFANEAIRATSVKQQHNQIVISQLLGHLDNVNDYETKVAIVNTIVFFFESIAKGPIGPVVEVLIPLVAQLLASTNTSAPASPSNANNAENPSELLQSTIVKCIGGVGKRVTDPSEKLEAMTYIMDKLRGNESNTKAITLLLQCVLQIAVNFTQLPASRDLPAKILQSLLNLSASGDPMIRILVQQIFQALLKAASKLLQPGATGYDPTEVQKRDQSIRNSLYKQLLLDNNEPENFYVIYETFVVLLNAYRAQELQFSLPIMFKLENTVVNEKTLASHLRKSVHSVVAAYLLHVAKMFDCGGLEEYVRGLLNLKEETSDFNSKVFSLKEGSFGLKKKVWKKKYLKKEVEEISKPIDKETVIQHLGKCPLVTQEYPNKDVLQLFAREMTEDTLLTVSSFGITTQRKKDQRKSERPRSDTTTEQRAAVNVITAETFTKIFETEKHEEPEVQEETLSRSSGRSGKRKETRSSSVFGTPSRKNTTTAVSPPEEFVVPAHSYAATVAMRNRQVNDSSMNKEYLFSLIEEAPKDGTELGPSSTVHLVYPNLLHATLV